MNRRKSRETAMGLLFELEYNKGMMAEEIIRYAEECRDFERNEYISEVFFGAYEHIADLDAVIEKHAHGWRKDRMSGVSLAIMRLSAYEILYCESIPDSVSINEAVELSKKFDEEKARSFINGVLNSVKNRLEERSSK